MVCIAGAQVNLSYFTPFPHQAHLEPVNRSTIPGNICGVSVFEYQFQLPIRQPSGVDKFKPQTISLLIFLH
jgi:hypothetical protein